jgi:tRNA dimethylallyltransferase
MTDKKPFAKTDTLVVITGPTAVGKTAVAIEVAQHFNTVILSADSRQFYKMLRIGTAAPDAGQLAEVSHYFIGHLNLDDYYNVSKYEQDALKLLEELFVKHNPVVMTGGSGLYIDAVTRGIDPFPDADPAIRDQINRWYAQEGISSLREKLKKLDPDYYEKVDLNNPNRLKRAIEVCLVTGKTYSSQRRNIVKERDFNIIKIGLNLPREVLFERIARRTEKMIGDGLLQEVQSLREFRGENALNTVGYKELFRHLDGDITLEQAISDIKTNTRRYAKRQLTWFKRDKVMEWFPPAPAANIIQHIEQQMELMK